MVFTQISSQQIRVLFSRAISASFALSTMAGGDAPQNLGQVGEQKLSVTQQQTLHHRVKKAGGVQMRACHSCMQEDLALLIARASEAGVSPLT